jgi:hypothetical protein
MTTSVDKYVGERAELLAKLVLTRDKNLEAVPLSERADFGLDMIVRIHPPIAHGDVLPHFGVNILGTSIHLNDEDMATKVANLQWQDRPGKSVYLFPTIVMLFSVDGDSGYYSWLLEPHVGKDRMPTLTKVSPLGMTKISKKTVDDIVEEVKDWFKAMIAMFIILT